jgi:hypothetical protein
MGTQQVLYNVPLVPTLGDKTLEHMVKVIIKKKPSERVRRLSEGAGAEIKEIEVTIDATAASHPGLGSRCGKHIVAITEHGSIFVVDGTIFMSPTFANLTTFASFAEDEAMMTTETGFFKLPASTLALGVFTKVPPEDTASVCGNGTMPIGDILEKTFLLHETTQTYHGLKGKSVSRTVLTSKGFTYVSDKVTTKKGLSEKVLVMDQDSGVSTTFERLNNGPKLYCNKHEGIVAPRVDLTCTYK